MIHWKRDSDEKLVAGVLAGRPELFSILVERYLPVVRSIAYARLRSAADVDDVAQESFLQAYQQLDQLRERRKFGPWVAAIARNVSVRAVKRRCADQTIAGVASPNAIHLPDFAAAEIFEAVRAQVEALAPDLREVVTLYYFGGKSSREIAAIMELTDAAVRKRLQRAREAVGDRLLGRFEADDLRGALKAKESVRRIVGVAIATGATWQGAAAAGAPTIVSGSATLLAAGGASKALVGLIAVLAACSGVLVWMNLEPASPPPEPEREWATALAAPLQEPPIHAEPPGGDPAGVPVSGRVLGTDGEPIPDAVVNGYYRRLDQKVIQFEAQSDETGAYRFYLDLPWGFVRVEANKEGFVSESGVRGSVTKDGVSGLDCTLLREAVVEGIVVDTRGNRLAEMPVSAHLYAGERHYPEVGAVTAEQGGFRLAGLLPGEHGLAVLEEDEFHELLEVARVNLSEGEVKTGVRLVYDGPGRVVAGRVVNDAGQPIAGAQFYTMVNRRTRSDSAGQFRMDRMREGIIALNVSHEHYQTLSSTVESGTEDVELIMQPLGSIAGIVVDAATKEPVQNFEIRADGGEWELERVFSRKMTTVSDPEGRFRLDGLKHDTSTLIVRAKDYAVTLKTVTAPAGKPAEDVVVELAPGGIIRGRVVDKGGSPVAGASVLLGSLRGRSALSSWQWAVSDVDGNFEIAGLPMRRLKISALHETYGKGETYIDVPQLAGEAPVVIELSAGGIIKGTVRRDGRPAPGVRVSATDVDGTGMAYSMTHSAADGSYELTMVPVGPVGLLAWRQHPSFPGGRGHLQRVDVVDGQTAYADIDVTEGTGTIEGEIFWGGAGEIRATANIAVADGSVRHKLYSSCKDGQLYVEDVPAGKASILVYLRPGDPMADGYVHSVMSRLVETEIKAGKTSYVTVSFSGSGMVGGIVSGVDVEEWSNIVALEGTIAVPDVSPATRQGFRDLIRGNAGIGGDGRYRLEGLEPGTYTLVAQAAARGDGIGNREEVRFATAVVTVAEGSSAVADFELR